MRNPVSTQRTATKIIALAGNPNTGKSTLFNALTGFRQRVGNYPGVTVDKRTGLLRDDHGEDLTIIDLPGAYSLSATSADEAVVVDTLLGQVGDDRHPDVIVVVVDAANLRHNLFLASQLSELGAPLVVALNMVDLAAQRGIEIDEAQLSRSIGSVVVPIVATKKIGLDQLQTAIRQAAQARTPRPSKTLLEPLIEEVSTLTTTLDSGAKDLTSISFRMELMQALLHPDGFHEERLVERFGHTIADHLQECRKRVEVAGEPMVELEARLRYAWIDQVLDRALVRTRPPSATKSERVDRFLTHRVFGMGVLLLVLGACFQSIYAWAAPLMAGIDAFFGSLGQMLSMVMPEGPLRSLLADGAIAGVGAVLIFLPQILILFLFIAILEDCGYMARAAFLLDRWMALLGLGGRSFFPLLSSFACAVPGILATRTIEHRRDRFVTIMIAPLMSCSARLPVYTLLIGAFVPATSILGGVVSVRALVLLSMYLVGIVVAIAIAFLLKHTILTGDTQPFLMELPPYRRPSATTVLYRVYEQGREFCVSAGTIIFAVTIVIWALGYYPQSSTVSQSFDAQIATVVETQDRELDVLAQRIDARLNGKSLLQQPAVERAVEAVRTREESFVRDVAEQNLEEGSIEWLTRRAEADQDKEKLAGEDAWVGTVAQKIVAIQRQTERKLGRLHHERAGAMLRASFLGRMGRWIEPVVKPLGWDWRIGTAVISAFPAREVIIATMGTLYNLGSDETEGSVSLRSKLQTTTWPDGRPVFDVAVALSIMVFFALCCQCGGTLAAIKRETKSWRWPVLTFVYMTSLAYIGALATYQLASRLL